MMFLIYAFVLGTIAIYFTFKLIFSYWKRNNFPFLEPQIPFGNMRKFAQKKLSLGLQMWELHNQSDGKFIGIYLFTSASILIRDVELAKRIMITDFDSFHDRSVYCNKAVEPLSANLFSMKGDDWRNLRRKLNPLFSSGKLKAMFPTILSEVENLDRYVHEISLNRGIFENKHLTYRYVLNNIASFIFGIELDTIANPSHPFEHMYRRILSSNWKTDIKNGFAFVAPSLLEFFSIPVLETEVKEFFLNVVRTTVNFRRENNVRRNDFMQLMIDDPTFTIEEITANCIIFYVAGADTTPFTTATCLYELAQQPTIQRKVQNEIDQVLERHDNIITYDGLQEMEFLDSCVKETLRKYPGLPIVLRRCSKNYRIPDTNLTIPKGTNVFVSTMGLHYDTENFPHPNKFDPNRFNKAQENYNRDAYLPFGAGPRQCIAIRMGLLMVKAALVKLLSKYDFEAIDSKPIEFDNYSVGLTARGGLELKVSFRSARF